LSDASHERAIQRAAHLPPVSSTVLLDQQTKGIQMNINAWMWAAAVAGLLAGTAGSALAEDRMECGVESSTSTTTQGCRPDATDGDAAGGGQGSSGSGDAGSSTDGGADGAGSSGSGSSGSSGSGSSSSSGSGSGG
jgi:hypothetical protein